MRWLAKNNATFNLSSSTHFQRKSHFHKKQEEELSFRNWATYLRRLCSCKHSNECATLYSFCSNDFSIIRLAKRQDTLFFKSKSLFGTRPFGEPDRKTRSKSHKKFQILEGKPSFGERRSTYYCHFLFIDIHCWPSSSSFSAFFFWWKCWELMLIRDHVTKVLKYIPPLMFFKRWSSFFNISF